VLESGLVRSALEARGWPVEDAAVDGFVVTTARGTTHTWPVLVGVLGDPPWFLVIESFVPVAVPAGQEVAAMEVVLRLGEGLFAGAYQVDFEDNSIRLRTSVSLRALRGLDEQTAGDLIADLVESNVLAVDGQLPAILEVVEGGTAPGIAVARMQAGLDA
jgi:hypothetical protein